IARPVARPRDPHPAVLYTLALHDALPISPGGGRSAGVPQERRAFVASRVRCSASTVSENRRLATPTKRQSTSASWAMRLTMAPRSEDHTSELQSRENLVCRLLLEKKKKKE